VPHRLRRHLTFANVVSVVALFVALGGSSYAAVALTRNSIKSKHIGKGQVKRSDLARNAVNGEKVANGSLRAQDFAPGELPAGERGPTGDRGPEGAPATRLFAYVAFDSPSTYSLGYGSGVVEVTNQNLGRVDVRFDRSVHGCVTDVIPATPANTDDDIDFGAIPGVHIDPDDTAAEDDVIRVIWRHGDGSEANTSFAITLFC
jgi:hypothetical protein